MLCNYHFKHQNYLTWANVQTQAIRFELLNQTHIFTKIHFRVTIPRNSKTLGFTVPTLNKSSVHFVNPHHTAIPGLFPNQYMINMKAHPNQPKQSWSSHGLLHFSFKNFINSVPSFWDRSNGPSRHHSTETLVKHLKWE